MSELHLPAGKKSERLVKGLLKPERKRAISESLSEVPDAAALIDKLQKQVAILKKKVSGHEKTIQKLWAWKLEQEMKKK